MSEVLRHKIITSTVLSTCVVIHNASATLGVGVLNTFHEHSDCVFHIVFRNASATPDEPPPKTFDDMINGVFDMYCNSQLISDAR